MRLRIIHLITTTIGGAGEHVLQLAQGQAAVGHEVLIGFARGARQDRLFSEAGLSTVQVSLSRDGNPFFLLRGLIECRRLVAGFKPDVLETHTSVAGLVGRVASVGVPGVLRVHMIHAYASHDLVPPIRRRVFRAVERGLDRITDHYIGGSDWIANFGIQNRIFDREKITRIHYALDLERFDRDLVQAPSVIPAAPRSSLTIGFLGRLEEQKGLALLMSAFKELRRNGGDARLIIGGDGPARGRLISEIRAADLDEGTVEMIGWVEHPAAFMRDIDVLVTPSRWEAFGIVNLEAMAAKVPVVATRVQGIPEVVEHGETGILVEPDDATGLAEALRELLSQPDQRARMGEAGRKRVEARFTVGRMVEAHEELFARLTRGTRPLVP